MISNRNFLTIVMVIYFGILGSSSRQTIEMNNTSTESRKLTMNKRVVVARTSRYPAVSARPRSTGYLSPTRRTIIRSDNSHSHKRQLPLSMHMHTQRGVDEGTEYPQQIQQVKEKLYPWQKDLNIVNAKCYGADNQDNWAIGIVYGDSPFSMCQDSNRTKNPIITCAHVTDISASYVADPFLYIPENVSEPWYLFFEVLNSNNQLGEIGAAISYDKVPYDCMYTINSI